MNKIKWMTVFFVTGCVCGFAFSAQARKDEVTLLMVPRDEATVQVGMDVANRYPTLLISYKVEGNGSISFHGWTGKQWVNITLANFKDGSFFKTGPDSALIVEKETEPVSDRLIPPAEWCMNVSKITTTQKRPLIHLIGQYFDFGFKDWQWFVRRYSMDMDAINPGGLNVAWYQKRLNEHVNRKSLQIASSSDLKYFESIRQVVLPELPAFDEVEPTEVDPSMDDDSGNLLINDVPPAIVLGVEDVTAEHQEAKAPIGESIPEAKSPDEM